MGETLPKCPQKYQIAIKHTKIALKNQMAMTDTKLFHPKDFPNIPKFGMKVYHLATLE
jgi:hypothetical protein